MGLTDAVTQLEDSSIQHRITHPSKVKDELYSFA